MRRTGYYIPHLQKSLFCCGSWRRGEEEGGSGVVKASAMDYFEDAEKQTTAQLWVWTRVKRLWVWTRVKRLPSPSSLEDEWVWQWVWQGMRHPTSKKS